jgi:hypothetical protein
MSLNLPLIYEGVQPIEDINNLSKNQYIFRSLPFSLGVDSNVAFFTSIFTSLRLYVV